MSFKRQHMSSDESHGGSHEASNFGGISGPDYQRNAFANLSLNDILDHDPRPTFVLNANADLDGVVEPELVNAALRNDEKLRKDIPFRTPPSGVPHLGPKISSSEFKSWIKSILHPGRQVAPFSYAGVSWTGFSVKSWIIVSGESKTGPDVSATDGSVNSVNARRNEIYKDIPSPMKPTRALTSSIEEEEGLLNRKAVKLDASFMTPGTPDWTLAEPEGDLSPHILFARSINWSATPLGAINTWSREFRQIICLLMANPHPAALFWGEELTVVYNQPYATQVAGHKHPALMGTGFRGPFKEIWDEVGPIFNECRRTGNSVAVCDQMLPIERHGFREETFFTWSLTPLYGGTGEIQGLYNAPFETTIQTRAARALQTLFRLGQETALAKSVETFWAKILLALVDNVYDFPFVILYSFIDDDDGNISQCSGSSQSSRSCILEGSLGVPEDHPAVPKRLDLKRSHGGFVPSFRDAMQTREPKLLSTKDGTLSESMMEGIEWRGYDEPCREAVVCPVRPTTGENVMGFLVAGVNPRRQFNKDYADFIRLLDRQLATALASVTLLEAEVKRGLTAAEAAALERSRLSEESAIQRGRLQKIAETSSVAMFSADKDGLILDANDRWFEMMSQGRDNGYDTSWMDGIHEDSQETFRQGWRNLTVDQRPWTGEMKLIRPWYDPVTGDKLEYWITSTAQPEFSQDGKFKSVMGSNTDISRIKWAENLQTRRLLEAEETRRAQNNFIDITSHEMRNPLSAILQCADGISTCLSELLSNVSLDPVVLEGVKESISSAETIQLCAQHQKSIVDDILTISKLDSNLLVIAPVPVQPVEIVRQALQMFTVECYKVHNIKLKFRIDKSFTDLKVNTVMLDSARLIQVLINLLTNAIKFTKSCPKKEINVSIGACLSPPTEANTSFDYFPTNKTKSDVTSNLEWGNGEAIYLRFEVHDTGCGLNPDEKKKLFNRFTQASSRTHVQYGGSGLGLFISRQLTELQGGEIGVASEAGVGSTFAFYVKCKRAPEDQNFLAIQKKLSSDLESTMRLSSNVVKTEEDHRASVSTMRQLDHKEPNPAMNGVIGASEASDPTTWHVLIVEDNLVNQKILAQQIRKLGSTVHVANHGGEALSLIATSIHCTPGGILLSVILMDLEMPVMDGIACVRKIREMESKGEIKIHLPIIAVTANARGEQIANARDSGMDDVMPKPFRVAQIKGKIEALLVSKEESADGI